MREHVSLGQCAGQPGLGVGGRIGRALGVPGVLSRNATHWFGRLSNVPSELTGDVCAGQGCSLSIWYIYKVLGGFEQNQKKNSEFLF